MEIEIKKQSVEKVNIELPYYSKSYAHFSKVYSEENCISVYDGVGECGNIIIAHSGLAFSGTSEPCTQQEFEEAYNRVSAKIKALAFNQKSEE